MGKNCVQPVEVWPNTMGKINGLIHSADSTFNFSTKTTFISTLFEHSFPQQTSGILTSVSRLLMLSIHRAYYYYYLFLKKLFIINKGV